MAKKKGYEGADAVRHAIKSHNLIVVSLPREVSLRAGLQRGVDIRVDQDPENPGTITLEALNAVDLSKELKDYLDEKKTISDKKAAKSAAKEKRDAEAKKRAEDKARKAAEPKAKKKKEPKAEKEEPEEKAPKKPKKLTAKEAGELLEARKAKAEEMGIHPDQIQPEWRPGDAVSLGPALKPEEPEPEKD